MDSPFISLTSTALVLILLIMIIVLSCHYFKPRAASWLRVNKEEKIGLSNNKLFHANGYMIYTGSDFFLSSSGSFKRFDTVDKEDLHKPNQQPLTTTLWNLPQTESQIPPQPLRPAPAPLSASSISHNKCVTFSFEQECQPTHTIGHDDNKIVETHFINDNNSQTKYPNFTSQPINISTIPQPISAPPPSRLPTTISFSLQNNTTAIPRPTAKRYVQPNGCNSSTNPFLCDTPTTTAQSTIRNNTANETVVVPISILKTNISKTKCTNENPFSNATIIAADFPTNEHNKENAINNHYNQTQQKLEIQQRNRSLSETEVYHDTDSNLITNKIHDLSLGLKRPSINSNPFTGLTQKVKGPHMLQKTISEDYLFRKLGISNTPSNVTGSWTLSRALKRQSSTISLGQHGAATSLTDSGSMTSIDTSILEHAVSCDSVASEQDVLHGELEQPQTDITGHLCVSVKYDKNSSNDQGMGITVIVTEARDIVCPFRVTNLDTFVRIYLVPDQAVAMQTKVFPCSENPNYNESFDFWLNKQHRRHSLWFHLYHNGSAHTLIGEAELEIGSVPNPITTWLPLSDSRSTNTHWGELMFSLSYLPTAERLTIVVVKARNLELNLQPNDSTDEQQEIQNIFVKVYLMNNEKKILKKRTSVRRKDRCPIFNEAMIFSMPPASLTTVQLRLTVFGTTNSGNISTVKPLGHIIAGSCATGKGLRHWHQMLSSLRKPVAMWHVLRRATNQPIFIGGAEAVAAAMQKSITLATKRNGIL